jgi:hypothetical protein
MVIMSGTINCGALTHLEPGLRVGPQNPARVLADERGVSGGQAGQVAGSCPHTWQPWQVCSSRERCTDMTPLHSVRRANNMQQRPSTHYYTALRRLLCQECL